MRVISSGSVAATGLPTPASPSAAKSAHVGSKNKSICDVQMDSTRDKKGSPKKPNRRDNAETMQYEMFDEIDAQDIEDNWYLHSLLF
jgi:hypothetical protein